MTEKSIKKGNIKKRVLICIICTLCISLLILAITVIIIQINKNRDISIIKQGEFVFSLWDKYPEYRHYMIEDMEEKIDIWNLSRDEIIELLGTNDFSEREDDIFYIVKRTSLPKTIDYYNIYFSDDGSVRNISVFNGS